MEKFGIGDDVLVDENVWDMGFDDSRILLENRDDFSEVLNGKNRQENLEKN